MGVNVESDLESALILQAGYSSFMIFALLVNLMAIGIALSIRYVMRQSEKKQKEVEAELAWLKNQINPHFLFNTLNNISSLTQQDGTLVFNCDNTNNPKPTKDRSGSGIGLENTRRRLDLLYSGRYQWEQTVTPEIIYHVKITLQL